MGATRTDITTWDFIRVETRGASEKYWVQQPGGSSTRPDTHWLFKPASVHRDGTRQVGDWAEVVASTIAAYLEVPAARAVLAERSGQEGVAVLNVRPPGFDMVTGRLAMLDDIGVETRDSRRDRTASLGHSLDNVRRTLDGYGPPPGFGGWEGCDAFDVLTSYLLLDALIANGDRHEQNWSVLRASSESNAGSDAIAAAYDMEASLGFQLTDEARAARLRDRRSLEAFAARGLARRFHGDLKTSLVDLAARAASCCSAGGQAQVARLVEAMDRCDFAELVGSVGGVSEVTRTFASEVLSINGRRIRDAIDG